MKRILLLLAFLAPLAGLAAPMAPASLTATGLSYQNAVFVQWSAGSSSGYPVGAYRLQVGNGSTFTYNRLFPVSTLGVTVTGVPCGSSLVASVISIDNDNISSPASVTVAVSVPCAPAFAALALTSTGISILAPFNSVEVQPLAQVSYGIVTSPAAANPISFTVASPVTVGAMVLTLTANQSYWIRGIAVDARGVSVSSVSDIAVLPPPSLKAPIGNKSSVYLSWNSVSSTSLAPAVTGYAVYYDVAPPTYASNVSVVADIAGVVGVTLTSTELPMANAAYYFAVATLGGLPGSGFRGGMSLTVSARTNHPTPKISQVTQSRGGAVLLSWTPLSPAQLGLTYTPSATYEIWKSPNPDLSGGTAFITSTSSVAGLSFAASAAPSTEYYFVAMSSSAGISAFPPNLTIGARVDNFPAISPSGSSSNNRVLLNWGAVSGADSYVVYRSTIPASVSSTAVAQTAGSSYVDVSPASGTRNYYGVTALRHSTLAGVPNAGIVEGAMGPYVTFTPLVLPGTPGRYFSPSLGTDQFYLSGTAVPDAVTGLADVKLQWARSLSGSAAVTSYTLYRGADLSSLVPIYTAAAVSTSYTAYAYTDADRDASLTYLYAVQASDVNGNLSPYLSRAIGPYAFASAPSSLSATVSGSNVQLSWPAAAGGEAPVSRYAVFRSAVSGSQGTRIGTAYPPAISFADVATPIASTPLFYSVFTVDTNNISSKAGAQKTVVSGGSAAMATTVTGVVVTELNGVSASVSVSWNPNPSAETVYYTVLDNAIPVSLTLSGTSFSYPTYLTYGANLNILVVAHNYVSSADSSAGLPAPSPHRHQPPIPLNLSPTSQADGSGNAVPAIQLSWTDMGASGVYLTGYNVFRSASPGFIADSSTYLGSVTGTSYRDTTVVSSSTYYYAVNAIGNGVTGTAAFTAGITAGAPPAAPAWVAAVPLTAGASIMVTWTAFTDAGRIWIYRGTSPLPLSPGAGSAIYTTLSGASTSFVDTGRQSGQSYYYAVAGANFMGLGAARSVTCPTTALPGPAASFAVAPSASGQLYITWTNLTAPADADGYTLRRSLSPALTSTADTALGIVNSVSDSAVTSGTRYYYLLASSKGAFGFVSSSVASAVAVDAPVAPAGVALIGLPSGKANISWDPPALKYNPSSFHVYYFLSTSAGAFTYAYVTLSSQTSSYLIGVSYTTAGPVVVSATVSLDNALGSAWSSPLVVTSNAALGIPSPANFSAVTGFVEVQPNFSRLRLNWTPLPGGTSYSFYGSNAPFSLTLAAGGPSSPLYLTTVGSTGSFDLAPVAALQPFYVAMTAYDPAQGFGGGESYPVLSQPQGAVPYSYPAYVSITAAQAGNGRFDMAWAAPAFVGSSGALNAVPYRIYRFLNGSTSAPGPVPDPGFPVATTSTVFSDLSVVNGSFYTYWLSSVDSSGREQYPPQLAAGAVSPQGPRQPPQQLQFFPGDGSVTIRWLIPKAEGLLNIKYNVYRRVAGTPFDAPLSYLTSVGPSSTQFVNVTQLVQSLTDQAQNLTTYYYALSAINAYGEGQKSDEVAVTPFKPVSALNSSITAEVVGKKNVLLRWNPAQSKVGNGGYDVASYLVLRSGNSGGRYDQIAVVSHYLTVTAYSFIDTSTDFGGTYVYTIVPVDSATNPPGGNRGVSYKLATINIPAGVNNILVFKNSFNPDRGETVPIQYSLVTGGHAWVRVYTAQGEYVATLFDEDVPDGTNSDTPYLSDKKAWDGRNANGLTVASGVYIIHVNAPGFSSNARVAVIK